MISNNFKKIVIGEEGLSLKYNNKEPQEISFSEINRIYIKVKKVPVKYLVLFVAVSFGVVLLLLWIYEFHLVAFSPFFLIIMYLWKNLLNEKTAEKRERVKLFRESYWGDQSGEENYGRKNNANRFSNKTFIPHPPKAFLSIFFYCVYHLQMK